MPTGMDSPMADAPAEPQTEEKSATGLALLFDGEAYTSVKVSVPDDTASEVSSYADDDEYDLTEPAPTLRPLVPRGTGALALASLGTGLCYDVRMRFHATTALQDDHHPEDPRRIFVIYEALCDAGLVQDEDYDEMAAQERIKHNILARIEARAATLPEILLVHTRAHYDFVRNSRGMAVFWPESL